MASMHASSLKKRMCTHVLLGHMPLSESMCPRSTCVHIRFLREDACSSYVFIAPGRLHCVSLSIMVEATVVLSGVFVAL